jgi:hypothetical protein
MDLEYIQYGRLSKATGSNLDVDKNSTGGGEIRCLNGSIAILWERTSVIASPNCPRRQHKVAEERSMERDDFALDLFSHVRSRPFRKGSS